MKSYQNSVSAVLFSTKEGKRNGNDPKAPMNPDAPVKRRSGFCITEDVRKALEVHIRTRDLKARKSITMAQVAGGQEAESGLKLVAWMDVVPPEERLTESPALNGMR
jgi:hypothetical protein